GGRKLFFTFEHDADLLAHCGPPPLPIQLTTLSPIGSNSKTRSRGCFFAYPADPRRARTHMLYRYGAYPPYLVSARPRRTLFSGSLRVGGLAGRGKRLGGSSIVTLRASPAT